MNFAEQTNRAEQQEGDSYLIANYQGILNTPKYRIEDQIESLPPDTQDFKILVTKYQNFYIDKTSFIRQILQKYDKQPILLITRPKGWGKSTNLSMLKYFLEVKVDHQGFPCSPQPNIVLFQGGKINIEEQIPKNQQRVKQTDSSHEKGSQSSKKKEKGMDKQQELKTVKLKKQYILKPLKLSREKDGKIITHHKADLGTHPIIYMDLGKVKGDNFLQIKKQIIHLILDIHNYHEYLLKTKIGSQYRMQHRNIIEMLKAPEKIHWSPIDNLLMNLRQTLEEYFRNNCYILIDNYDYPVLKLLKAQKMDDIRKTAALIYSLFSDFQSRPYVPPSSSKRIFYTKGQRYTSARAILMGKTNIFSNYLHCYVHYSVGDPNFYAQFGLNSDEIIEKMLPQVLQILKVSRRFTHFQLQNPQKYQKIKRQLFQRIKFWYGGYKQQLGANKQSEEGLGQEIQKLKTNEKYGYSHIWMYLQQYINEGTVGSGRSFWIHNENSDFDEMWYFRRIFKAIKIGKIFEFQMKNPPFVKLCISQFLPPKSCNNSYLSGPQIIHIGYSMGLITGIFLPICAQQTHIIQPHCPNQDILAKFKSSISKYLEPIFTSSQNTGTVIGRASNRESFNLMDQNIFKAIFEDIVNKMAKIDNSSMNSEDQCCHIYYKGLIYYRVLYEKNCGYSPAALMEKPGLYVIDNIFFKTGNIQSQDKNRLILIDIRHCKTSEQSQINKNFLSALKGVYQDVENLRRLVNLLQSQKNIQVSECYCKIRIGVVAHWSSEPNHRLFLLPDMSHSYHELLKVLIFFQSRRCRTKWQKVTLDYEKFIQFISRISSGEGEAVYKQVKKMNKQLKADNQNSEQNNDIIKQIQKQKQAEKKKKKAINLEQVYFGNTAFDEPVKIIPNQAIIYENSNIFLKDKHKNHSNSYDNSFLKASQQQENNSAHKFLNSLTIGPKNNSYAYPDHHNQRQVIVESLVQGMNTSYKKNSGYSKQKNLIKGPTHQLNQKFHESPLVFKPIMSSYKSRNPGSFEINNSSSNEADKYYHYMKNLEINRQHEQINQRQRLYPEQRHTSYQNRSRKRYKRQ